MGELFFRRFSGIGQVDSLLRVGVRCVSETITMLLPLPLVTSKDQTFLRRGSRLHLGPISSGEHGKIVAE